MKHSTFTQLYARVKERSLSAQEAAAALVAHHPALGLEQGAAVAPAFSHPMAEGRLYGYEDAYLRDHLVDGQRVLIGVTFASLAIEHYFRASPEETGVHLHGLEFRRPVAVKPAQSVRIGIRSTPIESGLGFEATCTESGDGAAEVVAVGKLYAEAFAQSRIDLHRLRQSLRPHDDLSTIYPQGNALTLGDSFKTLTEVYVGEREVLARVALPQSEAQTQPSYALHPLLINSAFLGLTPLVAQYYRTEMYLPFGIRDIRLAKPTGLKACWLLIRLAKKTDELILFDFDLIDDDSRVVGRFEACALKRLRAPQADVLAASAAGATASGGRRETVAVNDEAALEPNDLYAHIQNYLIAKITQACGIAPDDLDVRRNIMDMGLESAQLVQLGAVIQDEMGVELYPTLFFEYTNVRELTDHFHKDHREKFAKLARQATGGRNASASATSAEPTSQTAGTVEPRPAPSNEREPIAVIGMHGRFAQADSLDAFWNNLNGAVDVMREVPADHWDVRPWFDVNPEVPDKTYCKWGSFIDGVDQFDAPFFNISRREAEWMDPQVRMLLESVHAAAEDAGNINRLRGTNAGVFVGACFHDYQYKIDELRLPVNPYMGVNNTHTVLANRISYHFDLTGPSITVDTACSSSLVALHQACQALRNGECEVAFVCGANLLLSSMHYRVFSSLKALSPTGRCHSFDASADGYVPGECVASVLLKPLSLAIRDGDHIEAVIRGSAALHGGYTPSFTAPSVSGEQNVILQAWDDAQVDVETITYLEAHGTGTKIGDPIEINGLKNAFAARTKKQSFCSVGSAKANIGHAEGAAGIVGMLKVILQMKHRRIPPLMGFSKLNPYISLEQSALRLDPAGAEWHSPQGVPRRSGISSFGVAGAYAHVVLEEYLGVRAEAEAPAMGQTPALIVLSARTEKALKEQVERLLEFIRSGRLNDDDLGNAAYTLQTARQPMAIRLALLAPSVRVLEEMLAAHLQGNSVADLYLGQVKRAEASQQAMSTQDTQRVVAASIRQAEFGRVLDMWVSGTPVNWDQLYGTHRPRCISLPTYPFARERYWLPDAEIQAASLSSAMVASATVVSAPKPALGLRLENTSNLSMQSYRTELRGDEFFLADHRVRGEKVLPGVVHLEMARVAAAHAWKAPEAGRTAVLLTQVVWSRPIVVGAGAQALRLAFGVGASGALAYEICAAGDDKDVERIVYSSGVARIQPAEAAEVLDIAALRAVHNLRTVAAADCYRLIGAMGLDLGARLRGIETIHVGPEGLLAVLKLPASLAGEPHEFVLHPSLTDAALQACACLLIADADADGANPRLTLPHSLQSLEVLAPTSECMWALIRPAKAATDAAGMRHVDIDLCDEAGRVCVRMRGLGFKVVTLAPHRAAPVQSGVQSGVQPVARPLLEAATSVLLASREWTRQAVVDVHAETVYAARELMFCDPAEAAGNGGIADAYQHFAVRVLGSIQTLFQQSVAGPVLLQVVFAASPQASMLHGLAALLKTAQMENPRFFGQVIEVEAGTDGSARAALLRADASTFDQSIRHGVGGRHVLSSRELATEAAAGVRPWKDQGIYLITGGAGKLGLLLAQEIVQRTQSPTLILAGRAPLSEGQRASMDAFRAMGAKVHHQILDVTDRQAVDALLATTVAECGRIDGIVHGAGVLHDELIRNRKPGALARVLAPKVHGLVNLDEASANLPLDFFLMFSSIAGVFGNAGQADYAAGNAFMDGYALFRQTLVQAGRRSGRSLSINWPLWQQGGMRPNEAMATLLREGFGMVGMDTGAGFDALYSAMSFDSAQLVVLAGVPDLIRARLLPPQVPAFGSARAVAGVASTSSLLQPVAPTARVDPKPVAASQTGVQNKDLLDKTLEMLTRRAASVLKMRADEVDVLSELDTFGFNSIALTEFVNLINGEFGLTLSPTVFYEYSTLARFGQHLTAQHRSALAAKLLPTASAPASTAVLANDAAQPELAASVAHQPPAIRTSGRVEPAEMATPAAAKAHVEATGADAVAIIGISGSFPMAGDLATFWANLQDGKDCISEIPVERWDWQAIYGDPLRATNKSNVKYGGFIDGVAEFDPLFFGISPREASFMDPQQRLLMTHAWRAVEDAGYAASALSGSNTAVFVGTTATGYGELLNRSKARIEAYTATGLVPSMGPNRMSYFLNLKGPSEPIETACSSALVAIHRGVELLRNGSCDMALVGGVNTILSPELHMSFNRAGMLSEDGRCKAFSAQANGFARGEGVGVMLLKRRDAAEADGDHIYGVIRGSAQNHGGRSKSLTAPNPKAQAELLKQAYLQAGVDTATVGYIEAHGTGTALGDPIEVDGLKMAFQREAGSPTALPHCGLGSVKSNVGHLELAAGVAGVFKVLMQLKHKTLVKTLHCDSVNPYIQLENSPFFVVHENQPWHALLGADGTELPRRAGVSSFGFGGTNCHIVIEEYVDRRPVVATAAAGTPHIIVLSAKNPERLREQARQLLDFVTDTGASDDQLGRIAYTLQVGRDAMDARLAVLATTSSELLERLRAFLAGATSEGIYVGSVTRGNETMALFAGDDELQEAVGKWLVQRKLPKLLRLWVQGLAVDWASLHGSARPLRMALPTYPFASDSYWIPKPESNVTPIEVSRERRLSAATKCYLEKSWQACKDLPAPRVAGAATRRHAILSTDETRPLAEALRRHLPGAVVLGPVDWAAEGTARRRNDAQPYAGCIDLVGCGRAMSDPTEAVGVLQDILSRDAKEGVTLLCITKGLEAFEGSDVNLAGATRVGLYRMLQSEYRHARSRHVDLPAQGHDEALALQIAAEYTSDSRDAEVCYRKGRRHLAVLREDSRWAQPSPRLAFPADQVLWVTGGTRGLGYLVAQHFVAKHGVRRLVLSGREDIAPREQWHLHESENTPMGKKVRAFQDLERQGVELRVVAMDLTDGAAVRANVQRIKDSLGAIGGVIHCAGTVSMQNPAFVRKSRDEIQAVLAPKVSGLDALYASLQDEPLQFFVLFSSVSALIPSLGSGLSDYAMANAYMDYFAQAHGKGSPLLSIQWPRWKESGMGSATGSAYDRTGLLSLSDEEGLAFLDAVLAHRVSPVVMPANCNPRLWNPAALMQAVIEPEPLHATGGTVLALSLPGSDSAAGAEPARAVAPKLPAQGINPQLVQRWLTGFFAEELRIPPENLRVDVPFQDYGMESVMLAQVVGRMERELKDVRLDPSMILAHPTIAQLAAHLAAAYPQIVTALTDAAAPTAAAAPTPVRAEPAAADLRSAVPPSHAPPKEAPDTAPAPAPAIAHAQGVRNERVAVVGLSAHLPDAPDLATFWDNLMNGRDSIREVPATRWDIAAHFTPDKLRSGKSISKWGAFLDQMEDFDPEYFKIAHSLAVQMDPLERQWLEVSAEALADAGYSDRKLWGRRVGVFVGARSSNYRDKLTRIDKDVVVGLGQNFIAAHLAHIFNFKGPNFVVDAACASSLTAIHLAVQSIQRGESEMALAGGVEILLDESPYVVLSTAQVLSPDGRCKTFDESANGIGLGEGCAVLVLKPLSRAIADGDKIYGVIDGSAINNDGHTMGITTPNPSAQSELIEQAIDAAGIDPASISYVETHGTGTLIGDPIELGALNKIFPAGEEHLQSCGVGSVKSNIGHLLSAAGAASMAKVLLSLMHRKLPPTIHCEQPNPRFNFPQSALYLVQQGIDWPSVGKVLRAGVSSFGLGGNNAHVIVSDEGVPNHLRATLEPRSPLPIFKRRRCWPQSDGVVGHEAEVLRPTPATIDPLFAWTEKPAPKHPSLDRAMLDLFDAREVFVPEDLMAHEHRSTS